MQVVVEIDDLVGQNTWKPMEKSATDEKIRKSSRFALIVCRLNPSNMSTIRCFLLSLGTLCRVRESFSIAPPMSPKRLTTTPKEMKNV